jgi:hypothetical protein
MTKKAGSGSESGSTSQWHGSADPDPHQYVMDPQHCLCQTWKFYCYRQLKMMVRILFTCKNPEVCFLV